MFKGTELVELVERDGFAVIPKLLDPASVLQVREELVALLDQDEALRAGNANRGGVKYESEDGSMQPRSVFDEHQHMLFFATAFSPALRTLIDRIISHPDIRIFTDRVLGKHYRLRVDYVRRLSGVNDTVDNFELPHEWHRDNPGAFTFGIFFDDVTPPKSGTTVALRGTHWQPFDPRFEMLLSERSYFSKETYPKGRNR